ncbi:hypothetical protein EIP86_006479 [Pleurotus ostreatoroseus]|nr:hypothetical protein EIP86_006479 [Pleurotus ostreatoroseus]
MDEVIGNLGEPLDFEGDDAVQDDALGHDANAEQKNAEGFDPRTWVVAGPGLWTIAGVAQYVSPDLMIAR